MSVGELGRRDYWRARRAWSAVQPAPALVPLPVLALILQQFPFEIVGFHSDNGSEYINGRKRVFSHGDEDPQFIDLVKIPL